MRLTCVFIFTLFLLTNVGRAQLDQAYVRGVIGSGLASSAPGTPFTLDFRPMINATAPYNLRETAIVFDGFSTSFTALDIQLDSSPAVISLLPTPANHEQVAYTFYDPAISIPGAGYPTTPVFVLMPQEWRDEEADGVLSGRLWVTNPSALPPGHWSLSVGSTFAVPEPGTGLGIGIIMGALMLCRRA